MEPADPSNGKGAMEGVAYHIDRSGSLRTNSIIDFVPPSELGDEMPGMVDYLYQRKISRHGAHWLRPAVEGETASAFIEYEFELVRLSMFADRPSRYQSFFALPTIDDIFTWPELVANDGHWRIFEVTFDDSSAFCADANYLHGSLSSDGSINPAIGFNYANFYWNGAISDHPKRELLLPLPVKIGAEITNRSPT